MVCERDGAKDFAYSLSGQFSVHPRFDRFANMPSASMKPRARKSVEKLKQPEVAEEAPSEAADACYWVLVCNPKKWAIDRLLDRSIERDTWGVRPSDGPRFAPGQLAIGRVGVDRRSAKARSGKPKLLAGIYALCEVESEATPGTGSHDEFWAEGEARGEGWPTVTIRYLRTYHGRPLTIERLRTEKPGVSQLLLKGFQGSSFPISAADFHAVMELLGEDLDLIPPPPETASVDLAKLAELEARYLKASPETKARISKTIERGPIGALVKKLNGYKCQLCTALGREDVGFMRRNGEPYIEAHHAMPVAHMQIGSLAASNIMALCANHHREVHFGCVEVAVSHSAFVVSIEGKSGAVDGSVLVLNSLRHLGEPRRSGRGFISSGERASFVER